MVHSCGLKAISTTQHVPGNRTDSSRSWGLCCRPQTFRPLHGSGPKTIIDYQHFIRLSYKVSGVGRALADSTMPMMELLCAHKKVKITLGKLAAAFGRRTESMHQSQPHSLLRRPPPALQITKGRLQQAFDMEDSGNQSSKILKGRHSNIFKASTKRGGGPTEQIKSLVSILFPNRHTVERAPLPLSILLLTEGI